MTIKIYSGCTAQGIEVDGEDYFDLSKKERAEILNKVLSKVPQKTIDSSEYLQDNLDNIFVLLESLVPDRSDCESEPCDQCGDTVSWNIYKI